MSTRPARNLVPYCEARPLVRNGDLLLWRPTSVLGRLICWFTASEYSHVGVAAWCGDVLLQTESLQWYGCRAVTLSSQVARWPGCCDVYRVPKLHGRLAAQSAIRRTGTPYGWRRFVRVAARIMLRLCGLSVKALGGPLSYDVPVICSELGAAAVADGDVAPPAILGAVPGDLAAPFSEYQLTLTTDSPLTAL